MTRTNRKVLFNIPNMVTFCRIAMVPVIVVLLWLMNRTGVTLSQVEYLSYITALFFALAGISDLVDGYYARKYGQVSILGKFVDPTADKLIHMAVMVMLIPLDRFPAWLVVVILFREILISGLRSVAAAEGEIIAAREWGKKKMVWMTVGLTALILPNPFLMLNSFSFGWVCMVIGLVYSFLSAGEYIYHFFKKTGIR